tara:strand:- start:264 stop:464 length:201 start_codon:yes stop_codon:yes gene_type:complete
LPYLISQKKEFKLVTTKEGSVSTIVIILSDGYLTMAPLRKAEDITEAGGLDCLACGVRGSVSTTTR